jgi:hypothetical protein
MVKCRWVFLALLQCRELFGYCGLGAHDAGEVAAIEEQGLRIDVG